MSELKVIDVDRMADVRSLSGQFYRKSEADEVISTIKAERDEYRYNLSCARNEIHNMQIAMREDIKSIAEKDKEIQRLENLCASYRHDCDNLAIREANALKEIGRDNRVLRHQKHKRCLAMANYLGLVSALVHGETQLEYMRRELKWLKLAEKFKEAK